MSEQVTVYFSELKTVACASVPEQIFARRVKPICVHVPDQIFARRVNPIGEHRTRSYTGAGSI